MDSGDLIETLWNVKDEPVTEPESEKLDLIETLWNVKSDEQSGNYQRRKQI